ncbi:aminotransferase-like domain-containing protein [Chitinilyticum piscinae]|uniref:Putative 8-amino-7-oxononanoate synthase n=1 Tax=Chitinilyticum piscinae TaxID=2866724 RepID=A0A8J7K2L1_9NEIS|nr:PLP-dependent aminotransferase family protein [Chitinilyticum piscinae]MBE9610177.1 PLP-dependent aminotransferase family protein [Chitinilyticum piscinae]
MTTWIPDLSRFPGPVYRGIVAALAHDIDTGRLPAGSQLPPHRLLADLLGVNVSTVTRAYKEAASRHLIGGEHGRGTYVLGHADSLNLFALADRGRLIDLSTNTPAYPQHDDDLQQALAALLARGDAGLLLHYQSNLAWQQQRLAAARWLALRGMPASAERIILCGGAQHAVASALALHSRRGDTILVEALTYPGMMAIARQLGLQLHPLAMDAAGVRPDALDAALSQRIGRIAVLMPTLHNPTTITMPSGRRRAIAEVLSRHDALLIEEDVYGQLPTDAPPPVATLLPQQVIYVTSLSKSVAPGLRFGILHDPNASRQTLDDALHNTSWLVSPLAAQLACNWINDGTAERRLHWQRQELAARQEIARNALAPLTGQGIHFDLPDASPHGWLRLPAGRDAEQTQQQLRQQGIACSAGYLFTVQRHTPCNALRISIGAANGRDDLARAMLLLQAQLAG